jgi:hypothetical protein
MSSAEKSCSDFRPPFGVQGNDNNLPYSAGRKPNVQDDNEFILLRVPERLGAR